MNLNVNQDRTFFEPRNAQPEMEFFTVENTQGTKLVLSTYGAAVISLLVPDRCGALNDIVLGYSDLQDYVTDEHYLGTVVGRYANRIAGSKVVIDNQTYRLSTVHEGYHKHGGLTGFNKKFFSGVAFQNRKDSGVVFTYVSPDMEEGFPGEFRLEVTYTLDNENNWTVEYRGLSTKATMVNLTQHTYFNLTGNAALPIDEHEFRFYSDRFLPVNRLQIPTGQLADVADTPFDFRSFQTIRTDLLQVDEQLVLSNGYDHSFVLETKHSSELKHAVSVRESASGRCLDVYTTEPAVHFYTGNFLGNIKGKNGVVYKKRSGFCLETQHFPDAPNQPHFPSTELKAGVPFYSKTIFKFSAY